MTQDLPVFFRIYGGRPRLRIDSTVPEQERALFLLSNGQLEILMVDASRPAGAALYQASMASHPVEPAREGVPRLIVGDSVLVGSLEIPARLHRLIREAQAGGGLDWPAITGLEEAMAGLPPTVLATADAAGQPGVADAGGAARQPATAEGETPQVQPPGGSTADAAHQPAPTPAAAEAPPRAPPALEDAALAQPAESATVTQTPFDVIAERRPSMLENLQRDPIGNGLSVVVLLGMILSLAAVTRVSPARASRPGSGYAIPLVALLGIVVAGYLTYIEASGTTAVCGPLGDCNTVQQSKYAMLFGVLPVGAIGLVGFIAMIAAWLVGMTASGTISQWARLSLLVMTIVGTLFSIYLTFLEPFVIGATCAWCLTSAVVTTVLMWLSAATGKQAWRRLTTPRSGSSRITA